jgi:receptor protein-tyrosine kinase
VEPGHDFSLITTYLRVLRRRWWVVVLCTAIATAAAIAFSLREQKLYHASADVLINRENLANVLTGTADTSQPADDQRLMQTQADLAGVEDVARRTLQAAQLRDRTPEQFLARASAKPKGDTDLLRLSVTDPDPGLATRLATIYARQFAAYRSALDTEKIVRARQEAQAKLAELGERTAANATFYDALQENEQQLATLQTLQTARVTPVQPATGAAQVQPRVVRDAVLGFFAGLVVGIGVAFLLEALDTRVRTAAEIERRLGLPLLGRLPAPPRKLRKGGQLAIHQSPTGGQAEAFRMLRTNLEFVMLDRDIRSILVTSAVENEGKSATAANLAVALASSGRRVILAELDMRRPSLRRLFDLDGVPGLTQVALGRVAVEQALIPISIAPNHSVRTQDPFSGNGGLNPAGGLRVMVSGPVPPDPGEFIAGDRLGTLLTELTDHCDLLIVDAPPLLRVGDAMKLSSRLDGILVVTRLNVVRRGMLAEMHRLLQTVPAAKLGFVVTDAAREAREGYGYGSLYAYQGYSERGASEGRESPIRH